MIWKSKKARRFSSRRVEHDAEQTTLHVSCHCQSQPLHQIAAIKFVQHGNWESKKFINARNFVIFSHFCFKVAHWKFFVWQVGMHTATDTDVAQGEHELASGRRSNQATSRNAAHRRRDPADYQRPTQKRHSQYEYERINQFRFI